MTIAKAIKKLRAEKNLTTAEFGAKIGTSRISVERYEAGDRVPQMETMVKLVKVFKLKPESEV